MAKRIIKYNTDKKLLNLGCGNHAHPDWVNLDFRFPFPTKNPLLIKLIHKAGIIDLDRRNFLLSLSSSFVNYNLSRKGKLPFPDNSFDAVYSSHLLEHLEYYRALGLIAESFRVIKPGGIVRIALPDLEMLAKDYIAQLDSLSEAEDNELVEGWERYDSAVTFMLDQMVRSEFWGRIKEFQPEEYARVTKEGSYQRWLMKLYRLLAISRRGFANWGELHKWMYDRVSVRYHLMKAGFTGVVQREADESYIEGFADYNLDTNPDGTIYKTDSFYMEGIKPK